MSKAFDMELFLAGVLTGSYSTRQRHLRQAKSIQAAIAKRWHIDNPWAWQRKHLVWFLSHQMNMYSKSTRYYYWLTVGLITLRLGKSWRFAY
jgi:hypothetical protein